MSSHLKYSSCMKLETPLRVYEMLSFDAPNIMRLRDAQ